MEAFRVLFATTDAIQDAGLRLKEAHSPTAPPLLPVPAAAAPAPPPAVANERRDPDSVRVSSEKLDGVLARSGELLLAVRQTERRRDEWTTLEDAASELATVFRRGTGDADIGDEWAKRQGDRCAYFRHLLSAWPASAFKEGVDLERAVDILWGLNTDEVFHLFVRERGWAPDDYRAWLLALLRHEILAPA